MRRAIVGCGIALLMMATPAAAQDIRWRQDYGAARKEATAAGKPLLLDFGTDACSWCRKLDATTFRDRGVVDQVNARFIPVKVDGERDEWVAKAAGVAAYPTVILISPDGRVLARHEGYADVAKMTSLLRQVPVAEERKPAPTVVPAGAVIVQTTTRTPAGELFALATADHDAGRYLACIERCDRLLSMYPDSPDVGAARRLAASITSDPAKWRKVTGQLEADLTALHRDLGAALGR